MNVSEQVSQMARQFPDKEAYVFEDQRVSYKEFDEAVTTFASRLRANGYQKGDHAALVTGNSPLFIIGLYGCLRAGLTVIPINPTYTAAEIKYILINGDVKLVITIDQLAGVFEKLDEDLSVKHYLIDRTASSDETLTFSSPKMKSFTEWVGAEGMETDFPELKGEDVALILYTSGTTGKPKGAMLTHTNIYSNAKDVADYLQFNGEDRVIATLPMFHVFCLTVALNAPLMNGGTILIVPNFSPDYIFHLASTEKATVFAGVPTMYNYLLQTGKGQQESFRHMRLCVSGGASMPVSLLNNFEKHFQVQISEGYGLSEASPVTAFNPLDRPRKAGSIGTDIVHVKNRIVDELGEDVPVGEVGELIVQGPNVMKGYYKMPVETAVAIRDEWLYTGDMARRDEEGYIYIVDRKKDLILVGGYNVYPREVEEVLYDHPDVRETAVVGAPHPELGETVMAFVSIGNPELTEDELIQFCKAHLAKYKVPSHIEFLEELPKNTTGKILRRQLRDLVSRS